MTDQTSETTPDGLDVAAVRYRFERAREEVSRITSAPGGPGRAWRWSIPAKPDRDTDLLLSDSLWDIPLLLAALDEAEFHIQQLTESRDRAEREAEAEVSEWKRYAEAWTESWQRENLDRKDAESARDAAEGVVREVRALAEEWGIDLVNGSGLMAGDDFAEAIGENGAWRFVRDLRAIIDRLAPVTTDATEGEA